MDFPCLKASAKTRVFPRTLLSWVTCTASLMDCSHRQAHTVMSSMRHMMMATTWQDSTYQGDRFNGHMGSQQHSQYLSQFSQVGSKRLCFCRKFFMHVKAAVLSLVALCASLYPANFDFPAVRRCGVSAPKIGGSFPEVISSEGGLQSKHF